MTERMSNTTKEYGLVLLVDGVKVGIENRWVDRWLFLSNFVSEMGNNHIITWTSSSLDDVNVWVKLNKKIDEIVTDEIINLSDCLLTVTYMMPTTGQYLSHCYVDDKIQHDRRKYFEESGRYIRRRGMRLPYTSVPEVESSAMHANFNLHHDPAYGVVIQSSAMDRIDGVVTRDKMPDEMVEWILELDLNGITGLMQNYYYLHKVTGGIDEDVVPWNKIKWEEVDEYRYTPDPFISVNWGYQTMQEELKDLLTAGFPDDNSSDDDSNSDSSDSSRYSCSNSSDSSDSSDESGCSDSDDGCRNGCKCNGEQYPSWTKQSSSVIKSFLSASYELPHTSSLGSTYLRKTIDFFLLRPVEIRPFTFSHNISLIITKENDKKYVTIPRLPNFPGFLSIILHHVSRNVQDVKSYMMFNGLLVKCRFNLWKNSHRIGVSEISPWNVLNILLRTCWQKYEGVDGIVRECYYPNVCRRIANSLGTEALLAMCELMMKDPKNDVPGLSVNYYKNKSIFVDIATKEMGKNTALTGFQKWPKL